MEVYTVKKEIGISNLNIKNYHPFIFKLTLVGGIFYKTIFWGKIAT